MNIFIKCHYSVRTNDIQIKVVSLESRNSSQMDVFRIENGQAWDTYIQETTYKISSHNLSLPKVKVLIRLIMWCTAAGRALKDGLTGLYVP